MIKKLDIRFSLSVEVPTHSVTMDMISDIVSDITLAYVIIRSQESIKQFAEGLEEYGMVTLLKHNPGLSVLLEYTSRYISG